MQPDKSGASAQSAAAGSGVSATLNTSSASGSSSATSTGSPVSNSSGIKGKILAFGLVTLVAFSAGLIVGGSGAHKNGGVADGQLDYSGVNQVYNILSQDYDGTLKQPDLNAGLKKGLVDAAGDPYTAYFTASEAKAFNEQLEGNFTGIGAELGQDKDKNLIVIAPISGTPADKAGVKPQDIIAEINGESTSGMAVEEAVSKIRGPKGTQVKLTIIRDKSQKLDLTITRDDINVPSATTKTLDGNIGYIRVATFSDTAGSEVKKVAQKLHADGVKGVVLDLRGNPGGRVDSAETMADVWLPKGKVIMQEKRDNTVIKTYTASGGGVFEGLPTVVLIDGGSASASEIVAGALLDNNAATLIGVKSYGKGSVQELKDLPDDGLLKVTIARWYRPNGQNIDKKGIEPTQKVEPSEDDLKSGNDVQLQAAQTKLTQQ